MSQLLPEATRHTLFTWTYGHPFYVYAVTERMRAMSLSRRLKRRTGVTRNLLNRLIEVDLVVQQDGTFDLRDLVLTVWLAYFHAGVELLTIPRQEILAQLKDSALRLARHKGILLSTQDDLQQLAERLEVRFAT